MDSKSDVHLDKKTHVSYLGESEIMTEEQLLAVIRHVPVKFNLNAWKLVYSITRDGVKLSAFLESQSFAPATLLVVRDSKKQVCGGFAADQWKLSDMDGYYGSGSSFVFTIGEDKKPKVFHYTGANPYIQLSGPTGIALGGGKHFALQLDAQFKQGSSGPCETFDSPLLASSEIFDCSLFEVWAPVGPSVSSADEEEETQA